MADLSIKSNPFVYGEYDNQYNNYSPGIPMPQKIHGLYMRYNKLMKFRPTHRVLATINSGVNVIGIFYSQHFNWLIVVTNTGNTNIINVYDTTLDYNSTPLMSTTINGTPSVSGVNFLELQLVFNSYNAAGLNDKNTILISGLGVNLKYIFKNNANVIQIADYLIDYNYTTGSATKVITPPVVATVLYEARLTLLATSAFGTTDGTQHLYHSDTSAYETFNHITASPTGSFDNIPSLLGGELISNIYVDRRQLLVLSNKGLNVIRLTQEGEEFSIQNSTFYRIDSFPALPYGVRVFGNFVLYATSMGLRVRAYSQIGQLYSPAVEPGCIPLPTVCPEMLNITAMQNIDNSQSLAVIDSGRCYFLAYPQKISDDPIMSPAGSLYPRTTYFESDDFTVLNVANNIEYLVIKRNSDGVILITAPDPTKGFLSMFANNELIQVSITAVNGTQITIPAVDPDLIKLYIQINSTWYLYYKTDTGIFHTNTTPPAITLGNYNIFPALSYNVGALFSQLNTFGNYDWTYSCLFEGQPLHIDNYGNDIAVFSLPNPTDTVSSITNCVLHRVIVPGEMIFESDTPPSLPAGLSQILLLFKEKTKDFLSFYPIPQQDQNLSSVKTEKVMSMLQFPVIFSTMTNTTSIKIRPVLNTQDTSNLTLVRFLSI